MMTRFLSILLFLTFLRVSGGATGDAIVALPERESSVAGFHALARRAVTDGEGDLAEMYFTKLLSLPAPKEEKRDALVEFGRFLEEKQKKLVKAAAVYEQVFSLFPDHPDSLDLYLRLGRIYRKLGSFKTALNKFYNVLHVSLRVKDGEAYKARALSAQFEIAETYFAAGEYPEASKFYARLKLIDMSPDEQSHVYFKSTYILFLGKDFAAALPSAHQFLERFPDSPLAPECEYLVIQSLRGLNRHEEALQETLKLLRAGKEHGKENPGVWVYWLQKIGNELANERYGNNDNINALSVYQLLAELAEAPEWRLPAVYQIALCFERLRHVDRALEAYRFIVNSAAAIANPESKTATSANLRTIQELAQWRLDHLQWATDAEKILQPLLGKASESGLQKAGFMIRPDLRPGAAVPPAVPVN